VARLTRELREALQRQTATAGILQVIANSPSDVQPVFDAVAERAMRLLDCWSVIVTRFDGEYVHFGAARGALPDTEHFARQRYQSMRLDRGSLLGRSLLERTVVSSADAQAEPDPQLRDYARKRGLRAVLVVPLLRDDRVEGALVLTRAEPGLFAPREIELVQTFADQAVIAFQNARLFEQTKEALRKLEVRSSELAESLQHQTATSQILSVISSSKADIQPVFDAIVDSAARLFEPCGATITALKDGQLHWSANAATLPDFDIERAKAIYPIPFDPERSPSARALLERRIIEIPDIAAPDTPEFTRKAAAAGGFQSATFVPLIKEDKGIGTIILTHLRAGFRLSEKQLALVRMFGDQAVIAIENARLFDEVQARTRDLEESLQQQTATAEVLKVISRSAFELDTVTTAILRSAMELCNAPTGQLHLRDDNVFRLKLALGHKQETVAFNLAVPIPLHDALHRRGPVHPGDYGHYEDMWNDPDYRFKKAVKLAGVRAGVVVPMFREDEVIGLFSLARPDPGPFTPSHIKLVQTFADQAAIAIENVRLFNEVKTKTDDLSEALQMQTATSDVLKVISRSAFDLQAVFNTLVSSAVELGGALTGTICVRDGDVFRYRDTIGAEHTSKLAQYLRDNPATPGRSTIAGRVLLSGKVERIPDCLVDPEYVVPMGSLATNVRSLLGVPLLRKEGVEGAIILTREEPGHFTDRQVEIVQTFADQAVIALENVRLFDEVQARTKELAASLDDLRKAQDRLVQTEKLASLGQLTAGIAHEIKNPLNFVNNFSALSAEMVGEMKDALSDINLDKNKREELDEIAQMLKSNLEKVVQHGKRADSIVKNMLQHSREGSGEHRLADINALVDESLNLAYHGARAEKAGFNIVPQRDLDPSIGMADVYPQEITRVLLNLISNGFYAATKSRGR
jgi:two-component system, NtrC family, sensor kinase